MPPATLSLPAAVASPSLIAASLLFRRTPLHRHRGHRGDQPVPRQREFLLVLAAFQLMGDAIYVPEAVEGGPGPAEPDQASRGEHLAVAKHVKRSRRRDRV